MNKKTSNSEMLLTASDEFLRKLSDELVRHGFRIGVDQFILAQRLLLNPETGIVENDKNTLAVSLGAIFCKTPEEQMRFKRVFEQCFDRGLTVLSSKNQNSIGKQETRPIQEDGLPWEKSDINRDTDELAFKDLIRKILLSPFTLISILAGISVSILYKVFSTSTGTSQPTNGINTPAINFTLGPEIIYLVLFSPVLSMLLFFPVYWLYLYIGRRFQFNLWLRKLPIEADTHIYNLLVDAKKNLFHSRAKTIINQLASVKKSQFVEIDIKNTVETSIKRGLFTEVFKPIRHNPQYLVLISLESTDDCLAEVAEEFCSRMRDFNIRTNSFWTYREHSFYRKTNFDSGLYSLKDLMNLYSDDSLIVIGNVFECLPSLKKQKGLLDNPNIWQSRIFINTGQPNRSVFNFLENLGFKIVSLRTDNLNNLEVYLDDELYTRFEIRMLRDDFPETLKDFSDRWLSSFSPSEELTKVLIKQLKDYLGVSGYRVLSASALYPKLYWELTLFWIKIISEIDLHTGENHLPANFFQLLNLPWFRHGSMPDWLRQRLLSELDKETLFIINQKIHSLLQTAIATDEKASTDKFNLDLASRIRKDLNIESLPEPSKNIIERFDDLFPDDRVWATYTKGGDLSVALPNQVAESLNLAKKNITKSRLLTEALVTTACLALGPLGIVFVIIQWYSFIVEFSELRVVKTRLHAAEKLLTQKGDEGKKSFVFFIKEKLLLVSDGIRNIFFLSKPLPETSETGDRLQDPEPILLADIQLHPRGLYVLFCTEMWERFSFYSMLALFTLYLRDKNEGFGWTAAEATWLYSTYLMFVYLSPLIGGFIADKFTGYRKAVMIGGFFFMAGYGILSIPSIWAVYLALTCLVIGNGFFKPNISMMVGNLYPEGSHLKDRAYIIYYLGINIGALAAPIVMEVVVFSSGFHAAFAIAAFGIMISVMILWIFKSRLEVIYPKLTDFSEKLPVEFNVKKQNLGSDYRLGRLSPIYSLPDWKRIVALLAIFAVIIVFWMVFHQSGSTLTYWADENTSWNVEGTLSSSIGGFWIIVLSIPLIWFWGYLDRRNLEPSTLTKMVIGMILTSLSFFILYYAARIGEATVTTGNPYDFKVSPFWLILSYMVASLGELMLSPMGLAMVSKIAPQKWSATMMGGWFVATAIGNKLTAIGVYWEIWWHSTFFLVLGAISLIVAIILWMTKRLLERFISELGHLDFLETSKKN